MCGHLNNMSVRRVDVGLRTGVGWNVLRDDYRGSLVVVHRCHFAVVVQRWFDCAVDRIEPTFNSSIFASRRGFFWIVLPGPLREAHPGQAIHIGLLEIDEVTCSLSADCGLLSWNFGESSWASAWKRRKLLSRCS